MLKHLKYRVIFILVVITVAFAYTLPSTPFYQGLPELIKFILPNKKLNLGLDLQGGMHLVLQVDTTGMTARQSAEAPEIAKEIIQSSL